MGTAKRMVEYAMNVLYDKICLKAQFRQANLKPNRTKSEYDEWIQCWFYEALALRSQFVLEELGSTIDEITSIISIQWSYVTENEKRSLGPSLVAEILKVIQ